MLERKVNLIIGLSAALTMAPAAAWAQQDSNTSSANSTTNLGTLVVAPQKAPNQSSSPRPSLKVQRSSLNLNLGVSPSPPPGHGISTPPKPQQTVQRTAPTPLHIVQPEYPASAYTRHVKGTVTVGFTIDASGTTRHIHIIDSHPAGIFDAAARAAVRQWLFQPATKNGQPIAENVSQTLVFQPPSDSRQAPSQNAFTIVRHSGGPPADAVPDNIHPVHLVPPQYPADAYRRNQGGNVTISFLVDPNGRTSHINVVYSKPRHIFDSAAKNAVRQWRFRPVAKPTKVVQTITFTPPN